MTLHTIFIITEHLSLFIFYNKRKLNIMNNNENNDLIIYGIDLGSYKYVVSIYEKHGNNTRVKVLDNCFSEKSTLY